MAEVMLPKVKDIAVVKRQVTRSENIAAELKIKTPEDLERATKLLGEIKDAKKYVAEEKAKQLEPAMATVNAIREFWRPFEDKILVSETTAKNTILEFNAEQRRKAADIAAKEAAKVEEGKTSIATAAKKIAAAPAPVVAHQGARGGGFQTRITKVVVVKDLSLVPREYLVADMVKIRDAVKAGTVIPGVEIEKRESIANV